MAMAKPKSFDDYLAALGAALTRISPPASGPIPEAVWKGIVPSEGDISHEEAARLPAARTGHRRVGRG